MNEQNKPRKDRENINLPADDNTASDEQLELLLRQSLSQWDASIEPQIPALGEMSQLVQAHKQQLRSRLWRDLLLLWIVGCIILSGLLLLLQSNITGFLIVQAVVLVSAAIFGIRYAGNTGEAQL